MMGWLNRLAVQSAMFVREPVHQSCRSITWSRLVVHSSLTLVDRLIGEEASCLVGPVAFLHVAVPSSHCIYQPGQAPRGETGRRKGS